MTEIFEDVEASEKDLDQVRRELAAGLFPERKKAKEIVEGYRQLFVDLHELPMTRERSLAMTKLEESYLWLVAAKERE